MRFDILTLFPEAFESFTNTSIIGRAIESKKIEINCFNIRDFSEDKHKKVDDIPYGGGAGMVMTCQPLFDAINFVKNLKDDEAPVIFFTPSKLILNQELAENFARGEIPQSEISATVPVTLPLSTASRRQAGMETVAMDRHHFRQRRTGAIRYILLCGHYEGIDQRVRDTLVDLEISVGNFVLTGGELPAQVFIDAVSRLIPGVLGKEESHTEESFSASFGRETVEYPHYTRPEDFRGLKVPAVLLSGHHAQIKAWKKVMINN